MGTKLDNLTTILFILVVLCVIIFCTYYLFVEDIRTVVIGVHTPTNALRKDWQNIEDILSQKEPSAVSEINKLLFELVKYENDVTVLLDSKASTQMGCISVAIAIVVAAFNFLARDFPENFSRTRKKMVIFLYIITILILMISICFSYQSFKVRQNYAEYNVDDLFNILKDKESGLETFWINNILENYQIYNQNSRVNYVKSEALAHAAFFFICGIIGFFVVSLILIFNIHGSLLFKKGVESWLKKDQVEEKV
jgi:predicted PurR-regulated permease PerM